MVGESNKYSHTDEVLFLWDDKIKVSNLGENLF